MTLAIIIAAAVGFAAGHAFCAWSRLRWIRSLPTRYPDDLMEEF